MTGISVCWSEYGVKGHLLNIYLIIFEQCSATVSRVLPTAADMQQHISLQQHIAPFLVGATEILFKMCVVTFFNQFSVS